jgi:hypothetical protein
MLAIALLQYDEFMTKELLCGEGKNITVSACDNLRRAFEIFVENARKDEQYKEFVKLYDKIKWNILNYAPTKNLGRDGKKDLKEATKNIIKASKKVKKINISPQDKKNGISENQNVLTFLARCLGIGHETSNIIDKTIGIRMVKKYPKAENMFTAIQSIDLYVGLCETIRQIEVLDNANTFLKMPFSCFAVWQRENLSHDSTKDVGLAEVRNTPLPNFTKNIIAFTGHNPLVNFETSHQASDEFRKRTGTYNADMSSSLGFRPNEFRSLFSPQVLVVENNKPVIRKLEGLEFKRNTGWKLGSGNREEKKIGWIAGAKIKNLDRMYRKYKELYNICIKKDSNGRNKFKNNVTDENKIKFTELIEDLKPHLALFREYELESEKIVIENFIPSKQRHVKIPRGAPLKLRKILDLEVRIELTKLFSL